MVIYQKTSKPSKDGGHAPATLATAGEGSIQEDLSVQASLGQLRVVLLFLFVKQLLDYAKGFNVSDETILEISESARRTAEDAVTAVSNQSH